MKEERQSQLVDIINEGNYISVKKLSNILEVSQMTIRRDLKELESTGKIKKIHGGARGINKEATILSTSQKSIINIKEKKEIGQIMNKFINPGEVIYFGAGTTILYSLDFLNFERNTIITNNLLVFDWLVKHKIETVILTGGSYFEKTGEFYGPHAESCFNIFNIDVAFHATNAINTSFAMTSTTPLGELQKRVLSISKRNYLVADHTKFNTSDTVNFARISDFDGLLTDKSISAELLAEYSKYVQIIN